LPSSAALPASLGRGPAVRPQYVIGRTQALRGSPSLHLKRYSRKNGYIVFGFHPPAFAGGLPAEIVKNDFGCIGRDNKGVCK